MDFISYLRRVMQDIAHTASQRPSHPSTAANDIRDFINDFNANNSPRPSEADIKTDEQIKDAATNHYESWRQGREQNIQSDFDIRQQGEEFRRTELANERGIDRDRIDNTFDGHAQNARNNALRRGIARSSIASGRSGEVEQDRIRAQHQSEQTHARNVERINQNIRTLEQRKNSALNDLDVDHARRIEAQIGRLENERQRRIAEAERANAAGANRQESEAFRMQRSEAVFLQADGLLSQMTPAEARAFLRDDVQLRAVLTSYHYMRLRQRFA